MSGLKVRTRSRQREVLSLLGRLERWQPTHLVMHLAFFALQRTRARINKEKKAPDGTAWPAWSPRYAAWRAKHAPKGGILLLSGDLAQALQTFETRKAGNWHKVKFGSDLPYADAHQNPKPGKRPKREFLGLSTDDRLRIRSMIERALKTKTS